MVTFGIVTMCGLLGMVIDVGWGYYNKQVSQAATDSAVLAGAQFVKDSGASVCGTTVLCQSGTACPASPTSPPVTNFDAACLYARANAFTGTGTQAITLSGGFGSPSGAGVSTQYWMTARATQNYPLSFLGALGLTNGNVAASASSGVIAAAAAGGCIWVMDPNGSTAFDAPGTSALSSNCTIHVNSTASNAFTAKGGTTITARSIQVVGTSSVANNASVTPSPTNGASIAADPLVNLPAPTFSGCDYTNFNASTTTVNMTPGVYCGGMKFNAGQTVNFASGIYIINGGGIQVSSSSTTLSGTGVMFYNTTNNQSSYPFGAATITGATTNLTAPTSGTYQGILYFRDRAVPNNTFNDTINGNSGQGFSGTIYEPNGILQFGGGSSTYALNTALITYDLKLVGNSFLALDATGRKTGIGQSTVSLVQ
jgi:hypothetical protein